MRLLAVTAVTIILLCCLQLGATKEPISRSDPVAPPAPPPPPTLSVLSVLLLGLTVGLSVSVYLCVLRYICVGCCQPVLVVPEAEALTGMV